jgi:hypothetical protein
MEDVFWTSITRRADATLSDYLASGLDDRATDHGAIMNRIKAAVSCHLNAATRWHGSADALAGVTGWVTAMRKLQAPDGLFDSGGNLASPPDSSFTINARRHGLRIVAGPPGQPAPGPAERVAGRRAEGRGTRA